MACLKDLFALTLLLAYTLSTAWDDDDDDDDDNEECRTLQEGGGKRE